MYDHSSVLIVTLLLVSLMAAIEVGYRIGGAAEHVRKNGAATTQINTIQGSLLGILALLLGFTFSLALQRYDARSAAVVEEANAIGTTLLRAQLLPQPVAAQVQTALRQYVDLRVSAGAIPLDRAAERESVLAETGTVIDSLWGLVPAAIAADDRPTTTGLFVQALNEMIDSYGRRDAALNRHVPEAVLLLLLGTFILTAGLVGYSSGLAGHRVSLATYVLVVLIVLIVFLIIDLDRPRRGLIEVSQQSLIDLQTQSTGAGP